MDSSSLKQFILLHEVRERTVSSFWKTFDMYRREEPEEFFEVFGEFDKKLLFLNYVKVALTVCNWDSFEEDEYNENHEYVSAYLDMHYNDKYIGYYSLLFNFSGEIFDDFFVIE